MCRYVERNKMAQNHGQPWVNHLPPHDSSEMKLMWNLSLIRQIGHPIGHDGQCVSNMSIKQPYHLSPLLIYSLPLIGYCHYMKMIMWKIGTSPSVQWDPFDGFKFHQNIFGNQNQMKFRSAESDDLMVKSVENRCNRTGRNRTPTLPELRA